MDQWGSPAHGQPIRLSDYWLADDINTEIQVLCQTCDHLKLLVVFAAKNGYIRLHNVEQLGHNLLWNVNNLSERWQLEPTIPMIS